MVLIANLATMTKGSSFDCHQRKIGTGVFAGSAWVCNNYFYEKQMDFSAKSIKPFMR
jgi:hypothetical protein